MVSKLDEDTSSTERKGSPRTHKVVAPSIPQTHRQAPLSVSDFIKLMRPHQWVKNGFVVIGALFAHRWEASTLQQVAWAFGGFCAMSSAVYVLNDIVDVQADRSHIKKRDRPIASGRVPVPLACGLAIVLALAALALAWLASALAAALTGTYALMNVAYSLRLKHIVIVDVFIISAGFMLRILTGTLGLHIPPSSWLLLCGLMVTLFLGFAKRRAELLSMSQHDGQPRLVLIAYRPEILDQFLAVTATSTILTYALYTVSPETVALHGSINLIYTVPIIVYGIFRYLYLLHAQGNGQDTARDLLGDTHMRLTAVAWLAATVWILS